jgi:hypothetical protein
MARDARDNTLFKSAEVNRQTAIVPVTIDVSGKSDLIFEISEGDDGINCDHFDLGDAVFLLEAGAIPASPSQGSSPSVRLPCAAPRRGCGPMTCLGMLIGMLIGLLFLRAALFK